MTEPTYIAQTNDLMTTTERLKWMWDHVQNASREGAYYWRVSHTEEYGGLFLLLEAWPERPTSEGEPRWQLTRTEATND